VESLVYKNTFSVLRINGKLAASSKAQMLWVSLTYTTLAAVLWWPYGKGLELWVTEHYKPITSRCYGA